jgi:hypothetical protein
MSPTGDHYQFGLPFESVYVKHGNMGIGGGTLLEGFIYIPDGSPPPVRGARTGWFISPELGIVLNVALLFVVIQVLPRRSQLTKSLHSTPR